MSLFTQSKKIGKQQILSIAITALLLMGSVFHYSVMSAAEDGSTIRYPGDGFYIEATEIIETDPTNGLKKVYSQGKYGYDDAEGNHVIPAQFDDAKDFSGGFAAVKCYNEWEGVALWGYIDTKGNKITDFIYDEAEPFSEGFGAVKTGNKWGFVNESGTLVIPAVYEKTNYGIPCFNDAMAWVGVVGEDNSTKYGAINTSAEYVVQPLYTEIGEHGFQGDVMGMLKSTGWGLVNRNYEPITEFEYYYEPVFSEGLAAVYGYSKEDGSSGTISTRGWGYINQAGELIIDYQYGYASDFSDGHAFVGSRYGNISAIIDKQGNKTLLSDDMNSGTYLLKPSFHDGLSYMKSSTNDKIGYIDYSGQWVIPPQFESINPFNRGLCFVSKDGTHYGVINKDGEIIQPFVYGKYWGTPLMYFDNNGLSIVKKNDFGIYSNSHQCVIDARGNVIIPFTEEQKGYYDENGIYHPAIEYDGYSFQTPIWENNYTEIGNIENFTDGVTAYKDGKRYLMKIVYDETKPPVSIDVTDNTIVKENGVISGQVSYVITNTREPMQAASAVVAIFDRNNRLVGMDMEQNITLNHGNNTVSFTLSDIPAKSSGKYTVKLFLWDSFNNMKPLAVPAVLTVQ